MAFNGSEQPLLSGLLDPNCERKTMNATMRKRRFRRTRSAPIVDSGPSQGTHCDPNPPPGSIFGNIHLSLKKVVLFLVIYLGMGTICFYFVRNQMKGLKTNGIIDAVYFSIVTMTTVGYGDLVPDSVLTKLLACAFVFTGMALIGLLLSKAADYLAEKQEMFLVKALHLHQTTSPGATMKEIETNKVKYKCILVFVLLLVLIISGTIFLITVEELDPVDAFYCVCSTITALGYGDRSFSTSAGRVFAIFWILTSTISLAQFFFYIAELHSERRQRALVKWVLNRRTTSLDLEAADLDDDGVVGPAEFVIFKLKEMGKISEEDISVVMEEFENLDVDQSGTLTVSDIEQAQASQRKYDPPIKK